MKFVLVMAVVALVSLLAAVAVTGLPADVPSDVVVTRDAPSGGTSSSRPGSTGPSSSAPTTPTTTRAPAPDATSTVPTAPTTTTPATPTTTAPAPPDGISVVVVNATTYPRLAAGNIAEVSSHGYTDVVATDALDKGLASSLVYFADGFAAEAEALAVAVDLDVSQVTALPDEPIAVDDVDGHLWLMLGADRIP